MVNVRVRGAAWAAAVGLALAAAPEAGQTLRFDKKQLGDFDNEACAFGDFNGDKRIDLACGDAWYENPSWTRHVYRDENAQNDWMDAMDVDGDGRIDILYGGIGSPNTWRRNPGPAQVGGIWPIGGDLNVHGIHSANLWDVDGDGKARELVSSEANQPTVWAEFKNGAWVPHTVSTTNHDWGSGVGDINGDGRPDIVRPDCWYEAPADPRNGKWIPHEIAIGAIEEMPPSTVHPQHFDHPIWEWNNPTGVFGHTVQIYVYDVDGDGLNDLIASSGHRMGIMWYRQERTAAGIRFRPEVVDGSVSEVHALELVDIDKDGDLDLVASKRWRGHPAYADPLSEDPLFIFWYEHVPQRPYWKRHIVNYDGNIGAGTKLAIADFDGDGDLDIGAIAKKVDGRGGGPWIFENKFPALMEEPTPPAGTQIQWTRRKLGSETNLTCAFADIDRDGKLDLVGGNAWYHAPDWSPRPFRTLDADGFSAPLDVDGDGWIDIVSGSYEKGLSWYKNPGAAGGTWGKTIVDTAGDYENGQLWDVDGDGKAREIVTSSYRPGVRWWEVKNGTWIQHQISDMACNFGAGVGDVNGDGRPDIIRPNAWFEAPADPRQGNWKAHEIALGAIDDRGMAVMKAPEWMDVNSKGRHRHTAQIFVYDVNKDGKNDIIASSAHGVGIFWYEQKDPDTFVRHTIDATYSQAHGLAFQDLNGDGIPDLLAGKTYRAGGDNDPQTGNPLVLAWYELVPGAAIPWIKHEITYGEGIGSGFNFAVADLDGDGDADFAVTGRSGGPWLFLNGLKDATAVRGPSPAHRLTAALALPGGAAVRADGRRLVPAPSHAPSAKARRKP